MFRRIIVGLALCVGSVAANAAPLLSEGFDNIATLAGNGWVQTNNSTAGGTTGWFQGNGGVVPSSDPGAPDSYIAANFNNAGAGGNISNWLITPTLDLSGARTLDFLTIANGVFPDRLEVRLSSNGASSNVGATDASVGDFTTLLFTVNPALADGGYPTAWSNFHLQIAGLGAGATGRIAFRYFVTDTNTNADYIGIDSVVVDVPEPATLALFAASLMLLPLVRRRKTFSA